MNYSKLNDFHTGVTMFWFSASSLMFPSIYLCAKTTVLLGKGKVCLKTVSCMEYHLQLTTVHNNNNYIFHFGRKYVQHATESRTLCHVNIHIECLLTLRWKWKESDDMMKQDKLPLLWPSHQWKHCAGCRKRHSAYNFHPHWKDTPQPPSWWYQ